MNAGETIQAAIERLTELQNAASAGVWLAWKQYNPLYGERYGIETGRGEEVFAGSCARTDVELVETLHRTIDAQLAILRAVLDVNENIVPLNFDDTATWPIPASALTLAKAILGGAK